MTIDSSPSAVEIRTPARIHLGMLSFGVPGVRSFGGVGVMLDRPGVVVRVRRANRIEARGPLAERAIQFAQVAIEAWGLGDVGYGLEVVSVPASHAGLGSGTQLGLAVAAGLRHLFRRPQHASASPPVSHPTQGPLDPSDHEWVFDVRDAIELARATGRGRRSCIGVYGFSRGGLIVEAGRHVDAGPTQSSTSSPTQSSEATRDFSPMIARARLPEAWRCVVIAARGSLGLHGEAERDAFARLPPVPAEVTAGLAKIAMVDLLPAAVEGSFAEFASAVRAYGQLAGKPFEAESARLPHAAATAQLLELLGELGITGCAQSSWGPTVIACCPSLETAGTLAEALDRLGLAKLHDIVIARFDSQGAVLREIE
jgi:predicted sugar kinase